MMNSLNLIGTDFLDDLTQTALADAIATTHNYLQAIATNDQLFSIASVAFGNNFDVGKLEALRQQWEQEAFSELPEIEMRSAADINGTNCAFSRELGKICLAAEFL